MAQTRKLVAVMFTDIVGYTALMSKDEERALSLLQRNRDLHQPLVAGHGGELLKEIGDGTLCCFQSAVDAVHCAIAIQKQAAQEPDLSLRIGIHLGDVVFSDGDVFGDGVNVASRIQEVAEPGLICISEQIYLQVRNHLDVSAVSIGAKSLKNVEGPIQVYAIASVAGKPRSSRPQHSRKAGRTRLSFTIVSALVITILAVVSLNIWWPTGPSDEPAADDGSIEKGMSIVVLPLDHYGDPERESFTDGMTEELTATLAKIEGLAVKARRSAMMFKDSLVSPSRIADLLGVHMLVEGSVLQDEDSVRITAQLIDGKSEVHIWSGSFTRHLRDVLSLQSEVARSIAGEIQVAITPEDETRLGNQKTVDPEAYDLYLQGRRYRHMAGSLDLLRRAVGFFTESIAIDSTFGAAHAGLARAHAFLAGYHGIEESARYARQALRMALEVDPFDSDAYVALGLIRELLDWDWEGAEQAFLRAAELNPGNVDAYWELGGLSYRLGRLDEAEERLNRLMTLDPQYEGSYRWLAQVKIEKGEYDQAIALSRAALERDTDNAETLYYMGVAYNMMGQKSEAEIAFARVPEQSWLRVAAMADMGLLKEAFELIENVDLPGKPWLEAQVHASKGDNAEAVRALRRIVHTKPAFMAFVRVYFTRYPSLQSDANYLALLREGGFEP